MKTRLAAPVILSALLTTFSTTFAVELQPTAAAPTPAAPAQPRQVRVSETASVLLKLKNGDVSEPVILAYIENARRNFDLSAEEIVYLKQEGVTDKVITAALNHHAKIPPIVVTVPQPQQNPASPAPVQSQPNVIVVPPQTTYVQPATPPVYVYSYPSYAYYDPFPYSYSYYPYRYGYYGYGSPAWSVNFRIGHSYGGHYGYGGYRGGFGHSYNVGGAHNFGHAVGSHIGGGFHGGHHR